MGYGGGSFAALGRADPHRLACIGPSCPIWLQHSVGRELGSVGYSLPLTSLRLELPSLALAGAESGSHPPLLI